MGAAVARRVAAALCALLVASCSAPPPASSPADSEGTASPHESEGVGSLSPSSSPTASNTPNAGLCQAERLDAGPFIALAGDDPLSCFGGRTLEVEGFLSEMGGIGGCPEQLIPGDGWLHLCSGPQRILVADLNDDEGLTIYLSPDVDEADAPRGSVVLLTGHFDDPAAATCGVEGGTDAENASIRERCRLAFVIEAVMAIR